MEDFANRLRKVNRHWSKWAKRNGITCYRVYDYDMPEYPFCIDWYEDHLHVSVYQTKYALQDDAYDEWLEDAKRVLQEVMDIPEEKIFLKTRKKLQRRVEQYEKPAQANYKIVVKENGHKFWVNLSDYLDTGLFLDHRNLRKRVQEQAQGKRVLNLFAYTGSFSVYAAAGGASKVTTVDLSNTYVAWAKENFLLNDFDVQQHEFITSDCMQFLKSQSGELYDIAIVDPPGFSNSKKMKGTWDTQRDYLALLNYTLQLMPKGGVLYFSNNLRGFQANFDKLNVSEIKNISSFSIPEDFRNKNIHHCFQIIK